MTTEIKRLPTLSELAIRFWNQAVVPSDQEMIDLFESLEDRDRSRLVALLKQQDIETE
jgi:hypothetical protein